MRLCKDVGAPGVNKRAFSAWLRGLAYFAAGNNAQAMKDARYATAYLPPPCSGGGQMAHVIHTQSSTEAPPLGQQMGRGPELGSQETAVSSALKPAVMALLSATLECADNLSLAAVYMSKALEEDEQEISYKLKLQRLATRLQLRQQLALADGGSRALEELLMMEDEEKLPEFKRKRPKFYYYDKWMRGRIAEQLRIGDGHGMKIDDPDRTSLPLPSIPEDCQEHEQGHVCLPAGHPTPMTSELSPFKQALVYALQGPTEATDGSYRQSTRVDAACNAVVDKLLAMDADDLDLMLSYPSGLKGQVHHDRW
eukprot:gene10393-8336_t